MPSSSRGDPGLLNPEKAKPPKIVPLHKYNQCHGPKGKFCGGSSGGGGGGSRSASNKPGDELKTHPPVQGARVKLAPLVGQKVTIQYWTEKPGSGGVHRCLRDVKVEGKPIKYGHMWAQQAPKSIMDVPYGQQQRAVGTVYRYKKKKGWDWAIGNFEQVTNKSLEDIEKYNQCHGPSGKFCSGASGGGGGGGGAIAPTVGVHTGPVYVEPKVTADSLQDKKFQIPDNLTADEYSSLRKYGATDYAIINTQLRYPDAKGISERTKFIADNIDSAIAKQEPLKAPMKVYRGTDYGRLFGKKKPEEIIGAKITDMGFMSTSSSSEVAERFGSTRMTITLPAGTKALDMAKNTGTIAARSEREMLLPRGSQIVVKHVTQTKGSLFGLGKKTYIEAELIPPVSKDIEKYNRCHGAGGKFCSGASGGGGGGSGFQNTSGELSTEETAALEDYAGPGFKSINNALRGKEPMTPELQKKIDLLDSAMAKNPLAKNETVFRGIKSLKFLGGESDPAKLVGSVITDKGFTSTSANSETAANFALGKGGASLTIHVPKGTSALDIRKHIFTDQAFEEHEVLLNRGAKMKITKAENQRGMLHLTAEVISSVEKYNHCHGPKGKFCSTTSGGGGGGFKREDVQDKHINAEYRAEIKQTMEQLAAEYPKTAKYIEIESKDFSWAFDKDLRQNSNSYAVFYKNKIMLNANQMNQPDLKERLANELKVGWSSSGNIGGIVDHEFGHAVMDRLVDKSYKNNKVDVDFTKTMNVVLNNPISKYAKTDPDEAFAEAFAGMRAGSKHVSAEAVKTFIQAHKEAV